MKVFHLPAIAMLALAACSNALPQGDLKGIAEEARMMANNATIETTAIEDVHPQGIRVETDGVYIKIGGSNVTEYGFFVPHDPAFRQPAAGDPSYTPLGEGVWRYDIAG
jgi:hypothetical protein